MQRRRRITRSSASPIHWPARGPCGIGAARATPAGSRARPGRGRTEALEQWTESGTEYQRIDCGRSSCAAVIRRPAHSDVYCCRGPKLVGSCRVSLPDCDDGHLCGSTVPVPAQLERFGRVGQWRVSGRRLVGLLSGYAVRVTQPLRLVDFGNGQTVLPELSPGFPRDWAIWSRRAVAGPGPVIGVEPRVAYAVRVSLHCPAGFWDVSGPSSRDASSKATPVYHPRG